MLFIIYHAGLAPCRWCPLNSHVRPQMARFTRYSIIAALFVATAVASYIGGVEVGRNQSKSGFASVLASVQINLGQTRLERLRELESDLARGCLSEALVKVRFDLHTQMSVLSSLYMEHKDTWAVESIARRDPSLPAQLAKFQKAYDSWTEPKCEK